MNSVSLDSADLRYRIGWSTARSRVLAKYPKAHVVWSHGGRMVLLHKDDNPTHYDAKVSDAWRTAYTRIGGSVR